MSFNGTNLITTWLSSTQVRANGTASSSADSIPVIVTNPDGVASNTVYVRVELAPVTPISVAVTPSSVTLNANATAQFAASVSGTTNQSVVWKVNGITGGNSTYGTVTQAGLYKAPRKIPAGGRVVTLSAVSAADPTKAGTATITLRR